MTGRGSNEEVNDEGVFTVSEAINSMGFGWFQLKVSIFTGMIWMTDAMMMMLIAIIAPAAKCHFGLSDIKVAVITSTMLTGICVGAVPYGWMMDRYGRHRGLVCAAIGSSIFSIAAGFASSYAWLLVFLFMSGVNLAAAPQAMTYYAEFLPTATRGRSIVCIEVFYSVGMMLEAGMAMLIMPRLGWRYVPLFSALPVIAILPIFALFPRSPIFLAATGELAAARASLEKVAKGNGTSLPPGCLVGDDDIPVARFDDSADKETFLESMHSDQQASFILSATSNGCMGAFMALFKPLKMGVTTAILWELWAVLTFVYFGLVLLTTEVLQGNLVVNGTCIEQMPASKQVCELSQSDYVQLIWTTSAEVPGLLVTVFLLEKIGRRRTLFVDLLGASVFWGLLVFVCNVSKPVMLGFVFGARMLITGAFQAAYVYTPEVYPTRFRALGLGLCNSVGRIGAISTPFVAQVVFAKSIFVGKLIYFLAVAVSAFSTLFLPYETTGKAMG